MRQRSGVTLVLDPAPTGDWVLAQEIQIEQVILNLARNAIEAMDDTAPERRRLTLSTRRANGDRVEVQVVDTGPGLSRKVMDNLFEPFVTTKSKGLGLGLSISSGIVEAHGGQLTVDTRGGEGTTFSFTLALVTGELEQ